MNDSLSDTQLFRSCSEESKSLSVERCWGCPNWGDGTKAGDALCCEHCRQQCCLATHRVAHNCELLPTQLIRKGNRIRRDCGQVERSFRRFGRAIPSKVQRCKAEAIGVEPLEHGLEAMCIAEPTMKKDSSDRTVTVDDMAHDHRSPCSIAAILLPRRRRMSCVVGSFDKRLYRLDLFYRR